MRPAWWMAVGGLALSIGLVIAFLAHDKLTRNRLLYLLPPSWMIGIKAWRHGLEVSHDIRIAMPDGVDLAASLYLPKGMKGPVPTVLLRLPYGRLHFSEGYEAAMFLGDHGYAVVVQDLRGTGDSGGELLPWRDAGSDGAATLAWIASQPWSNGKVGTLGCSALGESQFPLAVRNEPAHAAMIASGAGGAVGSFGGRFGYFGVFEGGVFQLASGFGWFVENGGKSPVAPKALPFAPMSTLAQLPVADLVGRVRPAPNGYTEFLTTALGDPRWGAWGYVADGDSTHVPALIVNTWGDQTVGDALALAEVWARADSRQRVVIMAGNHCEQGNYSEGPSKFGELLVENAGAPLAEWYVAWFDRWLGGVGDGLERLPAFTYFMLVENRWYGSDRWPPAEAEPQRWLLGSRGHANASSGDGVLGRAANVQAAFDEFTYDPSNPVPSRGGPVCCTGDPGIAAGPADQRDVESRQDVLVYTSEALSENLRIAGPLKVRLTVSSDAPDTDIVARLVDVWPDGHATNIQEGALRLRYRDGFISPTLLTPGRQYQVTVDMRAIAYQVQQGHRLRLQITSSSFPRLERNLNTGAEFNSKETKMRIARNRIYYDPAMPSYIELYVLNGPSGMPRPPSASRATCRRSECRSEVAAADRQVLGPGGT